MGRHSATAGAAVDPLVAAALARRRTSGPVAPRGEGTSGGLGWPEPPPSGDERTSGGVGWPGSMPPPRQQATPAEGTPAGGTPAGGTPARRAWRRLFGSRVA